MTLQGKIRKLIGSHKASPSVDRFVLFCGGKNNIPFTIGHIGELTDDQLNAVSGILDAEFLMANGEPDVQFTSLTELMKVLPEENSAELLDPYFAEDNFAEWLYNPQNIHPDFQPSIEETLVKLKTFFAKQTLSSAQQMMLCGYIHVANQIRDKDGSKSKKIENIYESLLPNIYAISGIVGASGGVGATAGNPLRDLVFIRRKPQSKRKMDAVMTLNILDLDELQVIIRELRNVISEAVTIAREASEVLKERLPSRGENGKTSSRKTNELKIPLAKIDYNQAITTLYENRPETVFFTSDRLLALLKGLPGGENVTITSDRIRQLPVWKKHRAIRESGKSQYWENMENFTTEGKLAKNGKQADDSE